MGAQIIYIKYCYVKDEAPAEGERFEDDQESFPSPVSERTPEVAREEGDADDVHHEHEYPRGRSQAV